MSTMSVASQVRSENTSLHKRKQADLAPETDCYCNPPLKSNWKYWSTWNTIGSILYQINCTDHQCRESEMPVELALRRVAVDIQEELFHYTIVPIGIKVIYFKNKLKQNYF